MFSEHRAPYELPSTSLQSDINASLLKIPRPDSDSFPVSFFLFPLPLFNKLSCLSLDTYSFSQLSSWTEILEFFNFSHFGKCIRAFSARVGSYIRPRRDPSFLRFSLLRPCLVKPVRFGTYWDSVNHLTPSTSRTGYKTTREVAST